MRYKPKSVAALHIALGGLPDKMRVETDADVGVSAKTVGHVRKVTAWPENLVIGNPHGNRHHTRHLLNQEFMQALLVHFREHGKKAIEKVARNQPAAYLKILALLVPREMKVEHSGGVKAMTDEQLEAGIEAIQTMLEARAGDSAKVIEGTAETVALPAPDVVPDSKVRRPNKVMEEADTAIGPRESKPRRKVPSPPRE
jgi:hypothetical protein